MASCYSGKIRKGIELIRFIPELNSKPSDMIIKKIITSCSKSEGIFNFSKQPILLLKDMSSFSQSFAISSSPKIFTLWIEE